MHWALACNHGESDAKPHKNPIAMRDDPIKMDFIGSKVAGTDVSFSSKDQPVINRSAWRTADQAGNFENSFVINSEISGALLNTMKCPPPFTAIARLIEPIGIR